MAVTTPTTTAYRDDGAAVLEHLVGVKAANQDRSAIGQDEGAVAKVLIARVDEGSLRGVWQVMMCK